MAWRPFAFWRTQSSSSRSRRSQLLVLAALDAEPFGLLLQVGRVVALVGVGPPAVEFEDPLGDVVEEVPVVRDGEDRARVLGQVLLEPLDALGVEVVGRLVEQQQVGLFEQQLAQRDPAPLAAGQVRHRLVAGRAAQRVHRLLDAAVEFPAVRRARSSPSARPARRAASRSRRRARPSPPRPPRSGPARPAVRRRRPRRSRGRSWSRRAAAPAAAGPPSRRATSRASPLEAWSRPAMILRTLDLPAPLGPTTPIFAPGRNDNVTSSRITLSPCALRTLYMV